MVMYSYAVRLLIQFVLIGIIVGIVYKLITPVLTISSYTFSIDPLLTKQAQQKIVRHVHTYGIQKGFSRIIIDNLLTRFSFCKKINVIHRKPGNYHIMITACEPLLKVNDQILMTNGCCVTQDCFRSNCLADIPQITIKNETKDLPIIELKKTFEQFPYTLLQSYKLIWVNSHELVLHDKQDIHFSIITNDATLPNQTMIERCNTIKDELKHKGLLKIKQWAADIRYKHQIIVSNKGGLT